MTADELADWLDRRREAYEPNGWAADMLRQQQAEIEALKKEAALQKLSNFTQEAESFDRTASHMADEYVSYSSPVDSKPIAWAYIYELNNIFYDTSREYDDWQINVTKTELYSNQIGLFAHPMCELTDEEIWETIVKEMGEFYQNNQDAFELCKSILKKAREQ